jgi:hypothetical protein
MSTLRKFFYYLWILILLIFGGCAARAPKRRNVSVFYARPCLVKLELTERSECWRDPEGRLFCRHVALTTKNDCEQLQVSNEALR